MINKLYLTTMTTIMTLALIVTISALSQTVKADTPLSNLNDSWQTHLQQIMNAPTVPEVLPYKSIITDILWSPHNTTNATTTSEPKPAIIIPPVKMAQDPSLVALDTKLPQIFTITDMKGYAKGDYFYVIGSLVNNYNNNDYQFVKIHADFYDKNHSLIGMADTYANDDLVKPEVPTTFKMIVSDSDLFGSVNSIDTYEVDISGQRVLN